MLVVLTYTPDFDKHLNDVYTLGHQNSHIQGLRDVYEAGRNHEEYVLTQQQAEEDRAVAAARAKALDEQQKAAAAKAEAAKDPEAAKRAQEEAKRKDEDAKLAKERADAVAKVNAAKAKADEDLRAANDKRAQARIAAAEKEVPSAAKPATPSAPPPAA